jgi:non-specific serine/threonine protein kinase
LLELGLREVGTALPAEFAYWRDFAARYVTVLCTSTHGLPADSDADAGEVPPPPADSLALLVTSAPPMPGGEYLTAEVLADLWSKIDVAFRQERAHAKATLQEFLQTGNPAWHFVGGLARRRIPTGRRLRQARGSQRRCEACAVPRVWLVSIPDPRSKRP